MAELLSKGNKNCLYLLKKDEIQLIYDTLVFACHRLVSDDGVSRMDDSIVRRRALMTAFGKAISNEFDKK